MSAEQLAAIAARLDAISEELADLAIDDLRGQLRGRRGAGEGDDDAGEHRRPAIDERRVTRARRAVEKAAGLLRDTPGDLDD